MNEATAREVVLVQAFETAQPAPPTWGDDDRVWATRVALAEAPGGPSGSGTSLAAASADIRPGGRRNGRDNANAEAFIARRAHHALQRLGAREPAAAAWLARRLWRWRWVVWALLAGLVAGIVVDAMGGDRRINLLAPPLWGVVLWNLAVYALLLGHALAHTLRRSTRPGGLVRLTARLLRIGRRVPGGGLFASAKNSGSAKALQQFAVDWLRVGAPLAAARATLLLHAAAAALGLGLIAGLYLRGLVLDYRAGWESTFLSADNARAVLTTVLAPAAALARWIPAGSGALATLPDAAGFAALRFEPGAVPGMAAGGAPAAPWIHLLALTLALVVVLPRALLAVLSALRAQWLKHRLPLPLASPYFQALARVSRGEVARVAIVPYASAASGATEASLRALVTQALGDTAQVDVTATLAFGAEDDPAALPPLPPGTTLAIALFDLAATPEAEHQGRLAQAFAQQVATILLVDETAFVRRFPGDASRLAQRRDAWRVFAAALGTTPVFANAQSGADEAAARGVVLAMRAPVGASGGPA